MTPKEPHAPPTQLCAVCARPLDIHEHGDRVEYFHGHPEDGDHVPVPVDPDMVLPEFRCDFCSTDLPGSHWLIPAAPFRTAFGSMSSEGWLSCDTCNVFVASRHWVGLVAHVTRCMESDGYVMSPQASMLMAETYERLGKAMRGPSVPVQR